jgi:hypothetical protein
MFENSNGTLTPHVHHASKRKEEGESGNSNKHMGAEFFALRLPDRGREGGI